MTIDNKILEDLKEKLLEEKTRLENELSQFARKTDKEGEFETKFPEDVGNEQSENAVEVEEYANNLALEKALETQLKDVLDALEKMEKGIYGKDEETGEDIDIERLKAYPAARTNISKK